MAGKSTYLRQAALTVIMAQAGSFVPASEAFVGMCDRIYCRVGASDNLARGESTFLVEMNETAYILHTATEKSLVIMDEVGRGTGTNDGLSIAWAVSEDLLNRVKCRTLFATHYHELSRIRHPRLVNRSMEVDDQGGEIVFLRKLKEGPAAKSYGLHVAHLAGLPETVLNRAGEIMRELEESGQTTADIPCETAEGTRETPSGETTESGAGNEILGELLGLNINVLTPMEALMLLSDWKTRAGYGRTGTNRGTLSPGTSRNKKTPKDENSPGLFDSL
jgi:DNA mismatch repair protein MutS